MGNNVQNQNRDTYIDAVAGLLIIHMIMGHAIQWAHLTDSDAVYLFFQKVLGFFMLWFCFKAGLFFKPKDNKTLIQSSIKRLLLPFLIFSVIGYVTWSCKMLLEGEDNWRQFVYTPVKQLLMGGGIGGNLPLWYLLTLFVARIVFNWIAGKKWYFLLVVFALIPCGGRLISYELPLYIANISMAIAFMGLGYLLKPYLKNKWLNSCCVVAFLLLIIIKPTYVDMRYNDLLYGNYYLWYIIALSGIISIIALFRLIPYRMPVLTYIGKNSMAFFCLHWIVFTLCRIVFLLAGFDNYSYGFVISAVVASAAIIPLINELARKKELMWVFGG